MPKKFKSQKMSRMNEISGKVRRWVHTALMVYSAKALPWKRDGLFALQCVQQLAKLIHGGLHSYSCLLYGFIDLLYRMGILHREITDMCLSVPCPAAVSALFPFVGIEKRQPFFPAVPCRQFVRFCCDKGPFCADLKTALCSRYGANDYLSFIMIFSGATFSVI